jgi:hypothetical protein
MPGPLIHMAWNLNFAPTSVVDIRYGLLFSIGCWEYGGAGSPSSKSTNSRSGSARIKRSSLFEDTPRRARFCGDVGAKKTHFYHICNV